MLENQVKSINSGTRSIRLKYIRNLEQRQAVTNALFAQELNNIHSRIRFRAVLGVEKRD